MGGDCREGAPGRGQPPFFEARNTPTQMQNVTENKKAETFRLQADAVIQQVVRVL